MVLPIVIAVACFAAGVVASSRWLPDLEEGTLGTIAFFGVCGLCGAVVAIVGIYTTSSFVTPNTAEHSKLFTP